MVVNSIYVRGQRKVSHPFSNTMFAPGTANCRGNGCLGWKVIHQRVHCFVLKMSYNSFRADNAPTIANPKRTKMSENLQESFCRSCTSHHWGGRDKRTPHQKYSHPPPIQANRDNTNHSGIVYWASPIYPLFLWNVNNRGEYALEICWHGRKFSDNENRWQTLVHFWQRERIPGEGWFQGTLVEVIWAQQEPSQSCHWNFFTTK